jgi:hypothetical protein
MIDLALLLQIAAQCPAHAPAWRIAAHSEVESGRSQFAIRDDTTRRSFNPASEKEAIALAQELLAKRHFIDAGVMKINSSNWARFGLRPETISICRPMFARASVSLPRIMRQSAAFLAATTWASRLAPTRTRT